MSPNVFYYFKDSLPFRWHFIAESLRIFSTKHGDQILKNLPKDVYPWLFKFFYKIVLFHILPLSQKKKEKAKKMKKEEKKTFSESPDQRSPLSIKETKKAGCEHQHQR